MGNIRGIKVAMPKEFQQFLRERTIKQTQVFVKWLFPKVKAAQNLSYYQAYIVKKIAFSEVKRLNISAYTRYGKSQTVAIAVAIYLMINEGKKVKFIGPTDDQAGIIKDYMSELILGSKDNILLNMAEITAKGPDRLKAEASQKRMTFTNGCEYRVVTAHGKGFAAMGHGGDLIIMDEAAMISKESYAKITRMLGDDPENATLVELFNPWDRDTKAFDHSISSRFERIQIDWRVGLQEGRTTQEHIDEMRDEITPLEFTVLYESCFPEETEDSLHSLKDIRHAEQLEFNLEEEYNEIIIELQALEKKKNTLRENEFLTKKNALMKEKSRFVKIISCDPADKGLDFTVIKWGICKDMMLYEPIGIYSEPKTDPMNLVGRLMDKFREYVGFDKEMGKLNCNCLMQVDCIGIGTGPVSRLRERKQEEEIDSLRIISCHNGEAPSDQPKSKNRKRSAYLNKKAENNFRLQRLFKARQVALKKLSADPEYDKLSKELSIMKWDLTSNEKKKIIDPDKSPDYNDALVYFIWKDKKSLAYDFL